MKDSGKTIAAAAIGGGFAGILIAVCASDWLADAAEPAIVGAVAVVSAAIAERAGVASTATTIDVSFRVVLEQIVTISRAVPRARVWRRAVDGDDAGFARARVAGCSGIDGKGWQSVKIVEVVPEHCGAAADAKKDRHAGELDNEFFHARLLRYCPTQARLK